MSTINRTYLVRVTKEVQKLQTDLPPEITCWPEDEAQLDKFRAVMKGPPDSPYAGGKFTLSINLTSRYPHEPPKVNFITRIHHPNIDDNGRICLDILKSPPKGTWKSGFNMVSTLMSIYLLLSNPNPDDPLDIDVANQFKNDRILFNHTAETLTKKHATGEDSSPDSNASEDAEKTKPAVPSNEAKNSDSISSNSKVSVLKAPNRGSLKLKSLSLKKGVNKEKIQTSSITVGPMTPIRKVPQEASSSKTPSKGSLNTHHLKHTYMDKIIMESRKAPQPSPSPILESEAPATVAKSTSLKKKGAASHEPASCSKRIVTERSIIDDPIKTRTLIEQENHDHVTPNVKKTELSTKKSAKKHSKDRTKKKEDSNGDISINQLDINLKTSSIVAKLTLSQSESISPPNVSTPKEDAHVTTKVHINHLNSPLLQSSTPPALPSKTATSPMPVNSDSKLTSSYFPNPTSGEAISSKIASADKTDITPVKETFEVDLVSRVGLSAIKESKVAQKENDEAQSRRKRGWIPPPLEDSIQSGSLTSSAISKRRLTFSLKKLKKTME